MTFLIPVKAVGKERHRYSPWTKSFYTPKKTKDFEAIVATYGSQYAIEAELDISKIGPKGVKVDITFYVKIPSSWSKKKKLEALKGDIRPTTKPDTDNVVKSIFDGLNKILYSDDSFVTEHSCSKHYAKEPSIEVNVDYL